jgi:hypothetical protein
MGISPGGLERQRRFIIQPKLVWMRAFGPQCSNDFKLRDRL